jgi:hypothetical protein
MTDTPPTLYCANHPKTETTLRCSRCNKPICVKCAVLTPTGYKCKECVRGQQKVFETAEWFDYPIAFIAAGVLSYIGSLSGSLGFFTIFIAPIAGGLIAEAVRLLTRKHRSKNLFLLTAAAVAIGSLPRILLLLAGMLFSIAAPGAGIIGYLLPLVWQAVFTVLATSTVYARLAGIQIH